MWSITLNPGFALLVGAALTFAAPRALRSGVMAGAGLIGLWTLLAPDFGAYDAFAQIGLTVVPFTLDGLNQMFGIAFIAALILIAVAAGSRRNRAEDAAVMAAAGGATAALFVGDLVSFVAASSFAGLAGAWLVFTSSRPGADGAGVRLLVWRGLESLLLLAGLALHLSTGAPNSMLARMDVGSLGDALIFAALLIRAAAPLAHVWLKDAIAHASPVGGAALSVYSSLIALYALTRLFPSEPILIPIGAGMIGLGLFFGVAKDDLRGAGAYALVAQSGVCVILIGLGAPLALSAMAALVFTMAFAFVFFNLACGALLVRTEDIGLSQLQGAGRVLPASSALLCLAGLAAAGAPGLGLYVSYAAALDAAGQWQSRWIWLLLSAIPGVLLVCLALRPALWLFRPAGRRPFKPRAAETPFPLLLASLLAAFFCFAISFAPDWLYRLSPTGRFAFAPYALDRLAPQLELLGAAALLYVLVHVLGLTPQPERARLLDFDAFFRGPVSGAGRWFGVVMLRLYGAWQALLDRLGDYAGARLGRLTRACDRPFADQGAGSVQLISLCIVLLLVLLTQR